MSYGTAHKARPDKKVTAGLTSGGAGSGAGGAAAGDMAGVVTALDTINSTLRATDSASESYTPDSLVRSVTLSDNDILFVDKPERFNDITNNGLIVITPTGVLVVMDTLANAGTIKIHNGGRLVT